MSFAEQRGSRRGFTLIELLVVVAIIALLISILLPSLNEARRQARSIICLNNLRTQGNVEHFYAEDNRGWYCRGIAGYNSGNEWGHYCTIALRYYDPDLKFDQNLWNPAVMRPVRDFVKQVKQFQCPDHPYPWNPFDYVSNAFPLPYTVADIDYDVAGGGFNGDKYRGQDAPDYAEMFKIDELTKAGLSASRYIFVSESHISLASETEMGEIGGELRYHSVFLTSQMPFGVYPRIANDRRHPGGINNLFWDGSGHTLSVASLDTGYGTSIGLRIRWFAPPPVGYE